MDASGGSMDVERLMEANRAAHARGRRGFLLTAGAIGVLVLIGVIIVVVVVLGGGSGDPSGGGGDVKTNTTTTTTSTTTTTWARPSSKDPIRGICYAPVPCTKASTCRVGTGTPEDMTMPGYANLWDTSGRGDFAIIRAMGANTIREYHSMGEETSFSENKSEPDRTPFLEAVKNHGLNLFGGVHQGLPCPNDDCYASWYKAVGFGLANGFGVSSGGATAWHEATWAINMINEVDAMVGQNPLMYVKRLISSIDGLLAAERNNSVTMNIVNLTNCFTTAIEPPLGGGEPSIFHGFASMEAWIKNPHLVSYTPRSVQSLENLAAIIDKRWFHCINAQIPWNVILKLIPPDYTKVGLGRRPWIIGEMGFNGNHGDKIQRDLEQMHTYAQEGNTTFYGTLFFQFQTAYFKSGPELNYGMFGLAEKLGYDVTIAETKWQKEQKVPVRCLTSRLWAFEQPGSCGGNMSACNHRAQAVAAAFRGSLVGDGLCLESVPMSPG